MSIADETTFVDIPCSVVTTQGVHGEGAGNREQGTGIVAAARSDESIGAESTATAFPVSSAAVLRIPLYQRTLSCNDKKLSFTLRAVWCVSVPANSARHTDPWRALLAGTMVLAQG